MVIKTLMEATVCPKPQRDRHFAHSLYHWSSGQFCEV